MLERLFAAARADVEDQIGWATAQAKGQARHAIYLAVLAVLALASLIGAISVGLVGLHAWLTALYGPLVAYLVLGCGLLALALVLLLAMRLSRIPKLAPPPSPRLAQPAKLMSVASPFNPDTVAAAGEAANAVAAGLTSGSRSTILGALALAALTGLIVGRRLRSGRRS
jgi:hypothetical protein